MPAQAFATKDSHVMVVLTSLDQWKRFCLALDRPAWATDANLSRAAYRVENYAAMEKMIEEITVTRTTKEWAEIFDRFEIAAGPVNTVEQMFCDPQVNFMDVVQTVAHPLTGPITLLRQPWNLSATPGGIRRPPPRLGEHTIEILQQHGLLPEQIEALIAEKIVFALPV
jgi:crotonobetainyl-CoA:carnitine CoA-transferase CaiB-like acyl-CoA transferase